MSAVFSGIIFFIDKVGDDVAGALFYFGIDLADIFTDDTEAEELETAYEPDGTHGT